MELKYLNTVRMILETGSFQEAARRLHYTQSTVTFQVQQLEKELNVKLFEKLGRRMALTQAGREVLPYMDGVLDAAAALLDYGKRETELKGTLDPVYTTSAAYPPTNTMTMTRIVRMNPLLSPLTGHHNWFQINKNSTDVRTTQFPFRIPLYVTHDTSVWTDPATTSTLCRWPGSSPRGPHASGGR